MRNKLFVYFYRLLIGLISLINQEFALKIRYRISMKKKLDLKNPIGFNEKMMWLNLYWQSSKKTECSDKYLVRKYVKEKCSEELLNPIYGVYKNVESINWDQLPEKFVLKSTYGSGRNIICLDKQYLNISKTERKLKKWLKPKLLDGTVQTHYSQETNVIIAEKYIKGLRRKVPNDYKFYCFHGKPKLILAFEGRDKGITQKMFYDLDWNPLKKYINIDNINDEIDKPSGLNRMIEYAEQLSEDFPFVRVDFYNINGKVIFGELTFTPAACLSKTHNAKGDKYLGKLLHLPYYEEN